MTAFQWAIGNGQWSIEALGLAATVIAVVGVNLNNRRRRGCFLLWMVSNSLTLAVHVWAGLGAMAGRDIVFLVLAVQGWFLWGRAAKQNLTAENAEDTEQKR